ncbi:MAG: trypsin-like peptidase domain-containing protein [Rudaea sp.]
MRNFYRISFFVAQCVTLGLAAAFIATIISPSLVDRIRHTLVPSTAAPAAVTQSAPDHTATPVPESVRETPDAMTPSYAPAVSRAAPAVVNIYANKVVTQQQYLVPTNPAMQRLFPSIAVGPPMKRPQQGLGSGVIVSADGYVLTNNHVIQGAEEINVALYDGRVTNARVIGSDAETDLAVLKIDASNLPSITIADKNPLNVGDVVLAIGNPFGIGRTVTMGIVSALGRQLKKSVYEDFIQTDAAINQGNSGGALVNAYGELIGINSDVYTPTGGNVGIGFAIPVATAKSVLEQIVAHGKVIRGWIGAEYSDVTSIQAPSVGHGVAVIGVYEKGPAAQAGLHAGDILATLDGEPITNELDLRNREAGLAPGTVVKLGGTRNGQDFSLSITLAERPQRRSSS